MRSRNRLIFLIFCLTTMGVLFAQEIPEEEETEEIAIEETAIEEIVIEEPAEEQPAKVALKIDLPLFDLPYQAHIMDSMGYGFFHTYGSLSMNQSVALTTSVYSSMHYGFKKLYDRLDLAPVWKNIIYYGGTAAGILGFAYVFPFGYPWMRYEFIRSILSRHGINSNNIYYDIIGMAGLGITDDQLSYFKAANPHDFIRMNESRIEGYVLFSDLMIRRYFFYNLDDLSFVPALINVLFFSGVTNNPVLLHKYNVVNVDSDSIKTYYENDKGQESRFFSGFDTVNWVYELFRPNEPYAARGLHPSGDGSVARYITFAQLSGEERDYLLKQSWLHYLNFVSPLLYGPFFGFNAIPLGKSGLEGNFALHHYFTSFGADIAASVFLKKKPFNMAFTLHNYMNYQNYFPAIEAELIDYPLNIGKLNLFLSPRVLVGMQPKGQVFKTASPEFLGLFGLRVDFMAHRNIFPYIDFIVKTNGWVAGDEYLGVHASVRIGVSMRF